ncbi:MAG: hypothetical protein LC745_06740, partial [Planctomycetia bacterium]|nr:hypothetical protein [Planctomycetia bacterium]
MQARTNALRDLLFGRTGPRTGAARRSRNVVLSCDTLEGRVTPSSFGNLHHAIAVTGAATGLHHHNSNFGGGGGSTS